MESLTENRPNGITSVAIIQVHERRFTPPLSEFEDVKMRNGAMVHLKTAYGPPVGHGLGAGLKGRGPREIFSVGPYDLFDDVIVCKFFSLIRNVLVCLFQ